MHNNFYKDTLELETENCKSKELDINLSKCLQALENVISNPIKMLRIIDTSQVKEKWWIFKTTKHCLQGIVCVHLQPH